MDAQGRPSLNPTNKGPAYRWPSREYALGFTTNPKAFMTDNEWKMFGATVVAGVWNATQRARDLSVYFIGLQHEPEFAVLLFFTFGDRMMSCKCGVINGKWDLIPDEDRVTIGIARMMDDKAICFKQVLPAVEIDETSAPF